MGPLWLGLTATLVFCAPGYPGAAEDAQPLVDTFAGVTAAAANWPAGSLAALYDPTEEGGLGKLADKDAAVAFVPFPFYVRHASELHLSVLAQADVVGVGTEQRWTLVARRGQLHGPEDLRAYSIVSTAGYAPEFVRGFALAAWTVPMATKIAPTGQVLGALRRVVAGEPVAVLLDAEATRASASLPFASDLQQVHTSAPVPVAVIAVVDARLSKARAAQLRTALLALGGSRSAAAALAALKLKGFVPPRVPVAAAP